jgi:hypothetical protein
VIAIDDQTVIKEGQTMGNPNKKRRGVMGKMRSSSLFIPVKCFFIFEASKVFALSGGFPVAL